MVERYSVSLDSVVRSPQRMATSTCWVGFESGRNLIPWVSERMRMRVLMLDAGVPISAEKLGLD